MFSRLCFWTFDGCKDVLKGRELGRSRRKWEDNIGMDLRSKHCGKVWNGFIWFSIGTSDGLF
jgi:hypothetical protein